MQLIITDHKRNDLRVSKSQRLLEAKTLQIPRFISKWYFLPGYVLFVRLLLMFYKHNVLYCHDLFLSYAGSFSKKLVFADLHENFYDCYHHSNYRFRVSKWLHRDKRILRMIDRVKDKCHIVTVSKSLAKIYNTDLYYPNVQEYQGVKRYNQTDIPHVCFIGRNRGLEHIEWHRTSKKFRLFIVSDNVPELNLPRNIEAIQLTLTTPYTIMDSCHIGIINGPDAPQYHISSPNKLFAYMANRMAVVAPNHMGEVCSVIDKYKCGFHAKTIEDALNKALNNPKETEHRATKGWAAVGDRYNITVQVEPVFERIKKIINEQEG